MLLPGPSSEAANGCKVAYSSWQTHMALGRMAYERGLYTAAVRNYRTALKTAEQLELAPDELAENLLGIATCDGKLGLQGEAENLYEKVLELEERISTFENENIAAHLNCLAVIYRQMGRLNEAESVLQNALKAAESKRVSNSTTIAAIAKNLAQISCERGQFDVAEAYLARAVAVCDTRSSRQTMLFAEILLTLTIIAARQCRYDEAGQFIEEAISILEMLTGGVHPDLADLLELAASMIKEDESFGEVGYLAERVNSIRRHVREVDR